MESFEVPWGHYFGVDSVGWPSQTPQMVPRGSKGSLRHAFGDDSENICNDVCTIFGVRWEWFLNIFLHGCCWVTPRSSFSTKLWRVFHVFKLTVYVSRSRIVIYLDKPWLRR